MGGICSCRIFGNNRSKMKMQRSLQIQDPSRLGLFVYGSYVTELFYGNIRKVFCFNFSGTKKRIFQDTPGYSRIFDIATKDPPVATKNHFYPNKE